MKRFRRAITAAILTAGTLCAAARGATIYVNGSNTNLEDGTTLETGWNTIAEGLDAMAASNAVSQGGHTLIVGPGTYKEQILLSGPSTGGHSGVATNYNHVIAQGEVIIDGENTTRNGVQFGTGGYCYYVHVDGFTITRCNWGMIGDATYHHIISNMTIYACRGGIRLTSGNTSLIGNINYCTIVGNDMAGLASSLGGGMIVRNSIVAFNGVGAMELASAGDIALRNTLLYGNGVPYLDEYLTIVEGKAAIEALPSSPYPANVSTNLVTDSPGYLNLYPFDVARVRAGSPIFTSAADGGCIGSIPSNAYTTVSVSALNRTFYVAPAPTGDDGRDETAAQNPATPWATLGRAALGAKESDTVRVAPATYAGGFTASNACPLGGSIAFLADGGRVTVNGAGQTAAMTVNGVNGIFFNGFSFTGATHGVVLKGVYRGGFTNCTFERNTQDGLNAQRCADVAFGTCEFAGNGYRGANLFADSKGSCHRFSLVDCNVYSNRPSNNAWGAVDAQGCFFLTLDRCRICDNNANVNYSYGVALSGYNHNVLGVVAGFFSLRNCAIYRNNQGVGFHYSVPHGVVDNCVIFSNRFDAIADGASASIFLAVGPPLVRNSVLAGNGEYGHDSVLHSVVYQHCAFHGNGTAPYRKTGAPATNLYTAAEINAAVAANTNNIVPAVDLGFRDAAAGDFRLLPGSPLVNAGTQTTPWALDLYGNPRLAGPAVDIGVHELQPPAGSLILVR